MENTYFNRAYPNKVDKATSDSKTITQIKQARDKKGIGFYCGKRHEYIFIEK